MPEWFGNGRYQGITCKTRADIKNYHFLDTKYIKQSDQMLKRYFFTLDHLKSLSMYFKKQWFAMIVNFYAFERL